MIRKQVPSWGTFPNGLTSSGVPGGRFLELEQPLVSGALLPFLPGPAVGSHPRPEMACWRPRPLPTSTSGLKSEGKNQRETTVCRSRSRLKSEPIFPEGILKDVLLFLFLIYQACPTEASELLSGWWGMCSVLGFCLQGWEGDTTKEARSPGSRHESDLARGNACICAHTCMHEWGGLREGGAISLSDADGFPRHDLWPPGWFCSGERQTLQSPSLSRSRCCPWAGVTEKPLGSPGGCLCAGVAEKALGSPRGWGWGQRSWWHLTVDLRVLMSGLWASLLRTG